MAAPPTGAWRQRRGAGDRRHGHTAIVLEAFDTSWPDPMARWKMFR